MTQAWHTVLSCRGLCSLRAARCSHLQAHKDGLPAILQESRHVSTPQRLVHVAFLSPARTAKAMSKLVITLTSDLPAAAVSLLFISFASLAQHFSF